MVCNRSEILAHTSSRVVIHGEHDTDARTWTILVFAGKIRLTCGWSPRHDSVEAMVASAVSWEHALL